MNPMRARVRALGNGTTRVDVYDDIGPGGFFSDGLTAKDFTARLEGARGPLDVHINSAGGDVADGIAIRNAIRGYEHGKRTVVDGLAASIASVIFQAGDERIVEPGSMIMVHDPFTGVVGNAAELRKTAETLDKHGDNLAQIYAGRAGGTAAYWRDVMQAETWFTAEEAVAAGLADRVGTGEASLPDGLDLAAFSSVPGRIAAALRSLPRAAAAPPDEDDEGEGDGEKTCPLCHGTGKIRDGHVTCPECHGTGKVTPAEEEAYESRDAAPRRVLAADDMPVCKTCKGKGRLKHPVTGKNSVMCPSCKGKGTYPPDSPDDAAAGDLAWRPRALAGDTPLGDGWVRGADGKVRFDPDGDGDDDSTPEGDSDHDYFDKHGRQVKPIPPRPPDAPSDSADQLWALYRQAVRDAGKVDNSPWDGGKAMSNGANSDDPAAFYKGICAGRKSGDPKLQSSWALPYRYTPDSPPNAAGVRNALARLSQTQGLVNEAEARKTLQAAMRDVNPDYEPEDASRSGTSGGWLEQVRAALPPLKGARA